MYTPAAFAETDLARLDALVEADPFVTLVTVDADGAPFASHLPVLYRRDGDRVRLEGHWARPNPQSRHRGHALAIVHGPHAYVSPGWYPDKEPAARVPTWNYAVAHLSGTLEVFGDEASLADLVARTGDRFEATVGQSWRFEPERDEHRRQLRGIVGFRFEATRIELKFKLGQNHPPGNRRAVADALDRLGAPRSQAVAALMRGQLEGGSGD
ncbi:PaiB family negative transcriptional regulator [Luteimonas sp. J16]|jgi:transcriptional regulator|uniref:FMN-binding negative transcriptional regulator n=1 Tax=unclassified Luteimonas TaxID=2629088 RepID=UPI00047D35AC|nr:MULTISPECIES: FMN-binding negative transcriptional regulator [unclassified Luteimonas]TWG86151.1 PaiB family negative transcriptional regulator [Luteimonas sp. J16]